MNYIKEHMKRSLEHHVLERIGDKHWFMRRPKTISYSINIANVGNHIVLVGDLTIGGPHGCVSAGGYGLEWFSSVNSQDYLCSKFLAKAWQWEVAQEQIEDWIANSEAYTVSDEDIAKLRSLLDRDAFDWEHGEPTAHELFTALNEIDYSYVDDGIPGHDYDRADAGWLCAVNEKFAELMNRNGTDASTGTKPVSTTQPGQ